MCGDGRPCQRGCDEPSEYGWIGGLVLLVLMLVGFTIFALVVK